MTAPRGNTDFAVYENSGNAYVMAYICTCGRVSVAFGDEPHGHFNGRCLEGHDSTVLAS